MPRKPPTFSQLRRAQGGDAATRENEYRRRRADPAQRQVDDIRNTAAWRHLSLKVRTEEPWCRPCREADRYTPCVDADHIVPVKDRPDLALVQSNVQPICRPCHNRKTAIERRS